MRCGRFRAVRPTHATPTDGDRTHCRVGQVTVGCEAIATLGQAPTLPPAPTRARAADATTRSPAVPARRRLRRPKARDVAADRRCLGSQVRQHLAQRGLGELGDVDAAKAPVHIGTPRAAIRSQRRSSVAVQRAHPGTDDVTGGMRGDHEQPGAGCETLASATTAAGSEVVDASCSLAPCSVSCVPICSERRRNTSRRTSTGRSGVSQGRA